MKVVVVASEAVPFSKTGGLADVAGSLPRALASLGHDATLIVPLHRRVLSKSVTLSTDGQTFAVPIGSRKVECSVAFAHLPGSPVRVILIDQPLYFDREGLYGIDGADYADNAERFLFFSRAVLEAIRFLNLKPDVLHCNDWQTGFIPVFLREAYRDLPGFQELGTLFTIHNMAYQGVFWHHDLPLTGLSWSLFNYRQLEFHGRLNFLKAGIVFSDRVSTVSPTYAREIQTPEFGCGLDSLLRHRSNDLKGIVNGIDTSLWNPAADSLLAARYDISTFAQGKAACKAQLQRRLNLPERPDVPLFAQIGRLDPQKGWDLVAGVSDDLLAQDVQMVVLGEGQPHYHELLDRLSNRHAGKLRAVLEFLPPLARQIEGGADLFLMPSLYEPCGLNQLYSQRYGAVPIVRATGGLADTVIDATPQTLSDGTATGFAFHEPRRDCLWQTILRALTLWPNREAWARLVRAGMSADWSWDHSAKSYVQVYEEAINLRKSRRA